MPSLRYDGLGGVAPREDEERSAGKVGYVHLRAMGPGDITAWYRQFYPAFDRAGLVIDVRHNRGGNIDSFILEKLLRRAWMYWQSRVGRPTGTCSTPSAATWSCWWTRTRPPTANGRLRRDNEDAMTTLPPSPPSTAAASS